MTFLFRRGFRFETGAVGHFESLVFRIVHLVGQFVAVHGVCTLYLDVVSGHCGRHILPAFKRVAFLLGCFGRSHGCSEHEGKRVNRLFADLEDRLVGIDAERTVDRHVVSRHRFGQSLPSAEGMTFLFRRGFRFETGAIGHFESLVFRIVHLVGQSVAVRFELGLKCQILFPHHNRAGIVSIPVGPLQEMVAFCRLSGNGQFCSFRNASASVVHRTASAGGNRHIPIDQNLHLMRR